MQTLSTHYVNNRASVTVIIVNWNCGAVLSKCLDHLLCQTLLPDRILVMDNGSDDESLETIPQNDLIDIQLLGTNLGFAAANNRALLLCETEYIALLNPDAFPNPDWLARLIAAADSLPELASFASLQLCDDNTDIIDGAGDSYHVSGLVWRERHGARFTKSDVVDKSIFSPCAAAALYRRQAVLDVGGFDEDFFCYVEDVDLGFRLRLAGHQAMYVSDAIVRHVGSVSTGGQHSDFCVYHGHRNLVWTYIKNMPGVLFWFFLPMHLLLNLVTIGYFVFKGQGRVILQAKFDAIKGLSKMWQKRKIIQCNRTIPITEILHVLDTRFIPILRK